MSPSRRLVRLDLSLVSLASLIWFGGCSLLIDSSVSQCRSDADCRSRGDAVCDFQRQLCVPAPSGGKADAGSTDALASGSRSGAACQGKDGCFACAPRTDLEFMNACTDARCVPFDNRRLHNLTLDGMLKPLP